MSLLRSGAPEVDARLTLTCPRDGAELDKVVRSPVTIDRCGQCRGTWFDSEELRAITGDKELEAMATRRREFAEPSGFACPRCGGNCVESFVQDVAVDTCTSCRGVWLDAGEMEEAQREIGVARTLRVAGPGFREFLRTL